MKTKLTLIFCLWALHSFGQSSQCDSLLDFIIRDRNARAKRFIEKNNMNVNCLGKSGSVPLGVAASRGNLSLVKYLLEKGANPNLKDVDGYTALFDAVFIYEQALEPKLSMNPSLKKYDYGIKDEIVKLLIKYGGDVHIVNNNDTTLLMYAIIYERKNLISFFIELGVDVNARNKSGNTALSYAIHKKDKEAIKILMQAGAR
jgi:ankyrin repeat protein